MQKDKLVERFLKHYEKDIIDFALKQKNIITELTDKKISNNAFEYIKSNKQFFIDLIFKFNKKTKEIIFMAGGPGVGSRPHKTILSTL